MDNQHYPAGSLRYKSKEGSWIVTRPRDLMFSTAIMLAEEYWCAKTSSWKPIFEDEQSEDDPPSQA